MPEKEFYLWQVRSFTVRLALDFIETLARDLEIQRPNHEEHGGLLFGRIVDNDTVEVTDFEFVGSKHRRGGVYDLGAGERHSVEQYVTSFGKGGGPRPVGCFRTHLRPGLFLDESDFALMAESFSEIPGIALAIRMDPPGPPNAGLFFWEDGDIDRRQTELMFPLDAAALRLQGPVRELVIPARDPWAWASELKTSSASLLWGIAAILAIAMVYEVHQSGGAQRIGKASVPLAAPAQIAALSTPPAPAWKETLAASNSNASAPFPAPVQDVPKTESSSPVLPPVPEPEAAARQADTDAEPARERVAPAEAGAQPIPETQKQSGLRTGLLEQLNVVMSTRDTVRGLVATVPDSAFEGSELNSAVSGQLARLAAIVQAHPDLRIYVEGNSDTGAGAVRRALIALGLPDGSVAEHGSGDANSGAAGREANLRVEIVIFGDPIDDLPYRDHPGR